MSRDAVEIIKDPLTVSPQIPGPRVTRGPLRSIMRWYWIIPAIFMLMVILAPILPIPDPARLHADAAFKPPVAFGGDWAHPLGTDQLGRDLFSRVLFGGRLTLFIVAMSILFGTTLGTFVGLTAGSRGGFLDLGISRLIDAQMALPVILLVLVVVSAGGRSAGVLIFTLSVISWAQTARLVRAETLTINERVFVTSLVTAGATRWRILTHHLLPNVLPTAAVAAILQAGMLFLVESSLSYLGLGVAQPHFTWGSLLADGRNFMVQAWWLVVIPGLLISLTILHMNAWGDRLRSRIDPTLRKH